MNHENQSWWRAFSEERADAVLKPAACCVPHSSIHKAEVAHASGRPTPTTNSCTRSGDKGPRRNAHNFWSRLVQSSCRYLPTTRDIYEPNVHYLGIAEEIVKYGSAARHPSPEAVGPTTTTRRPRHAR